MDPLELYFAPYRANTVGRDLAFRSPYGEQRIVYADWTASGRLYRPIEQRLLDRFGPHVGNTHSQSSETGRAMTLAYHEAHRILKAHVHAGAEDLILSTGSGMTGAINKFQRILGLKAPQGLRGFIDIPPAERPVVFITHMEHHSNQTSWHETIAEVVVIPPDQLGQVDLAALEALLQEYRARPMKIGSFTACSNVTGLCTPYHAMAALMHRAGGVAFIDFAASAPYVDIDMHPADPEQSLDAVLWSPHKFLGGPGSSGVLVFNRALYRNTVPDDSGGGTVNWTNPWGQYSFLDDIEAREDAGTPGFLQAIKAALAVQLKDQMGVASMQRREQAIVAHVMEALQSIPGVHVLAPAQRERLAIFSFYVERIHYNLVVQLLNDRFGVQSRGGCSCAGTYGHYLLHVDPSRSHSITERIDHGDLSEKPGWVRLSFHPTSTMADIDHAMHALREIVQHIDQWAQDYEYSPVTNEFAHRDDDHDAALAGVRQWFELELPTAAPSDHQDA
ncbi:MAG: aminotransferase class V-fold PLP-dependent enzyme [Rhodanobacter sp.]|nr:MAG: aminotransferase class V-fold PLP-dependent enzyme [Rhodanobacter sp.]TAM06297.1 MAG: aminotransferase class V-fold PLP-dependent enzyme [Rhodanobacter sp.]TAM41982.1 MAG: aminotransferase class V-fold PLP-dependent enzyme [Rhodanobacter sp.]TAN27639.1 MAG: aminotransferase class V-fold PLP-dependent enzyme [Rhodanobacter sp.]